MTTMASSYELPEAAAEGFMDAGAYDAHRPSYPPEAVEELLRRLKIADKPNVNVLEIAAGTGKFTELLAKRHENYTIHAVEPHAGMRAQLEKKQLRNVTVTDGHAAKMPVEDEWADACIAAQSFHWFATDEALKEIHRVLAPNAVLGMIWNIEEYNKPKSWPSVTSWGKKLNDWIWSISTDGLPRFRDEAWQSVFEKQTKHNPIQILRDSLSADFPKFSLPLGEETIKWTVWLSEDALWARINTLSQVAVLQGPGKEEAYMTFKEALQSEDVMRNERGEIALHGVTFFAWTDKIGY
ncbi:S-adenosyl-L-methionine-dependent methyltransferase [Coniochaeta sp. 2T2.1]|nr:S-adenosyl-L-methionine-dependent methyltransferase [Coniochaeta sp. 2T2.1]